VIGNGDETDNGTTSVATMQIFNKQKYMPAASDLCVRSKNRQETDRDERLAS
jgi:hypothetical protein